MQARTPSSSDPTITVRPPPGSALEAPHDGSVAARSAASGGPEWVAISHGAGVYTLISGDIEPVVARHARVVRGARVGRVLAGDGNASPEVRIELVFKRVASDVKRASRGAQEPWTEGNIDGDFVFNAKPPAPAR